MSCERLGNGNFLTAVVNFVFPTSWADLTLLCAKICRFFWAEIPGKRAETPGKKAEMPRQTQHDSTWKHEVVSFFREIVTFFLKWTNLKKLGRNQTKICPGQKFVTNEYPGMQHPCGCASQCSASGLLLHGAWLQCKHPSMFCCKNMLRHVATGNIPKQTKKPQQNLEQSRFPHVSLFQAHFKDPSTPT